jgi:alpha-mannosidase
MQKHRALTLARLGRFQEQWQKDWYAQRADVTLSAYHAPDRIPYDQAMQGDYSPIAIGHQFAPLWSTHWVRVEISIPEDWAGKEVHLRWDSSSEAGIWRDGVPLQGLSGTGDYWHAPYHDSFILTQSAQGGETLTLYVEVAVNNPFGMGSDPIEAGMGKLRQAEIAVFQRVVWDAFWDFAIIADMAKHLPDDSPRAGQALATANAMTNAHRPDDLFSLAKMREIAHGFLVHHNGSSQHRVHAVGHAHIDTAWLWPLAETRRKCVRSFSTVMRLMERYPDYTFVCSQAQQLAWIRDDHPELYDQIKARVEEGRFIPVGGAWVEPDCNIPSGESLVRQFVYGQAFYEREFGQRHRVFWLPDTFGYASALPQILQGVGIPYFLTQKLSWNQFNKLPANTFHWEGLDGSRVLAHFPPVDTYNGLGNVEEVMAGTHRFRDHDRTNVSMYVYGFGDGGGGPSDKMLEQLGRMADVDGLPHVSFSSPDAFFDATAQDGDKLVTWRGELYFELHRGTYTSQAFVKQGNRRSEFLLRDVEMLASWAQVTQGYAYPQAELERLWKIVLLNQFHDILPGSSIGEVYEDARVHYADVLEHGERERQSALKALMAQSNEQNETSTDDSITVVNTLSHERREVIAVPFAVEGAQKSADGEALVLVGAPSLGYRQQMPAKQAEGLRITPTDEAFVLENNQLRAVITNDGLVQSLFDKRLQQEALAEAGNRFVLYDDRPIDWDAWDVEVYHREKPLASPKAHHAEIVENGALRVAIRFDYRLAEHSTMTQTIALTATGDMLTFDTHVDWHADHQLLKVEFPLNVHAMNATYETQFGIVERPTHSNTSWDMAKFEVCGHRWGALLEYGWGVALLNDCKYGYSAHDNVLALSLLRAPSWPHAEADRGEHDFAYALMPNDGKRETLIQRGLQFNAPLLVQKGQASQPEHSFVQITPAHVVVDTIKRAEHDDSLIMRLYEACGARGEVSLQVNLPVQAVRVVTLLEEAPDNENDTLALQHDAGRITFDIRPYQIVTLKLVMGG